MTMPLEMWGGAECTVNRVHDRFFDQDALAGDRRRAGDVAMFAGLGLRALRYPILWERVSPKAPDRHDWAATDEGLAALRHEGVSVVAGLVHHGSGPRYTDLLDDGFASGLARHADAVARRYPWIETWTPVNEPLTTARFAALYGHWYPHRRDEGAFWRALLNQIDGVRLAMRAIRAINPAARLLQTDDLGRTYAPAPLGHQATFDNLRRWAGWDMLCGRLTPRHPLWPRIARYGLEARLRVVADDPCPPDLIGINHYLTSDRFLDHRLQLYPPHTHGGSESQRYADVEAVRVLVPPPAGLEGALREAWARYGIPIVVSEVHNGCTREEQLRWLAEAWAVAGRLREDGIDVRAVTVWALLGSHNWNTLLTRPGVYEPGVFDLSGGAARPTALATLVRALAMGSPRPPLAAGAGWWRRPTRLLHPPVRRPGPIEDFREDRMSFPAPPLLILGATGTLGQAIAGACVARNIPHVLAARNAMSLGDPGGMAAMLDRHRPWAVANAAGWVRVDDAERERDACLRANATGAISLARLCADRGIATLSISSDLVFDGGKSSGYREDDPPNPINVYGESKARMEAGILALPGGHLVVRTAAFFSPFDTHNFAMALADRVGAGVPFLAARDVVVSPTYVPHLVATMLDLLIDGETGLWHLANDEALSWAAFASRIARRCGFDARLVRPMPAAELGWSALRPANSGLRTGRGSPLPALDLALDQFAAARPPRRMAAPAAIA